MTVAPSQQRARRRLIVNADDFGFTTGVTAGILEAHAAGTVTSTSMMVHCPGWDDAVRHANATPTLGIGLHLNLLVGAPIAKARSLTDSRTGQFASLTTIVTRALTGRLDAADVTAECEAQLDALSAAGINCTHIDSHRHTHALPVIRGAVAAIASARGLPLRRPVEAHSRAGDLASQLHRGVIAMSWRVTSIGAPRTRRPEHFIGVSSQGSGTFAADFTRAIDRLEPGTTEFMVHPGHTDSALESIDSYTSERERELAALTSRELRDCLGRDDLTLIGFGAL
jgi:predicted glycoside hydrolase/deacetylase ChbG (UPF0249 family)